jgi:TonB-dependent SusC/RagA subfamily outer membrane receptor
MLIDVSGHSSGLSLGVPALAGSPSTLERRLRAMTMKRSTGTFLHGSVVGSLGIVAVLAACDASMPTSAEIQAMGAEAAVEELEVMGVITAPADLSYYVNGFATSSEAAMAINPVEIVEIRIDKSEGEQEPRYTEVRILTREGVPLTNLSEDGSLAEVAVADLTEIEVVGYRIQSTPAQEEEMEGVLIRPSALQIRNMGEPLFLINEVPVTEAEFRRLDPASIESISVRKDEAAEAYGPQGANGVILVTTK